MAQPTLALLERLTEEETLEIYAFMEAADISVSIDLLVRSLLALGIPRPELGRLIGRQAAKPAA